MGPRYAECEKSSAVPVFSNMSSLAVGTENWVLAVGTVIFGVRCSS